MSLPLFPTPPFQTQSSQPWRAFGKETFALSLPQGIRTRRHVRPPSCVCRSDGRSARPTTAQPSEAVGNDTDPIAGALATDHDAPASAVGANPREREITAPRGPAVASATP